MTNYNERLDEILTKLDQGEYLGEGGVYTARTAITSLNKELVAEAKPEYCDGGKKCSCSTGMEKYINSGKETAIIQFEHNLLKALEGKYE